MNKKLYQRLIEIGVDHDTARTLASKTKAQLELENRQAMKESLDKLFALNRRDK